MTRDEIAQLVRQEVARVLLHAAETVLRADEEPRRDRPNRLAGDDLEARANEIAGQLPEPTDAAGLTASQRRALDRLAQLRAKPTPVRKPSPKKNAPAMKP